MRYQEATHKANREVEVVRTGAGPSEKNKLRILELATLASWTLGPLCWKFSAEWSPSRDAYLA